MREQMFFTDSFPISEAPSGYTSSMSNFGIRLRIDMMTSLASTEMAGVMHEADHAYSIRSSW